MKITKNQLKALIREGIFDTDTQTPELTQALKKLLKGIESLDTSVDYLSAVMTGTSPLSTGVGQKIMGRYRTPPAHFTPGGKGELKENDDSAHWKAQLEEAIANLYGTGLGPDEIRERIESAFNIEIKEVYSKEQRGYMCSMKDASDDERPEGLSQDEAEEMCTSKGYKKKKGSKE